jgi:hypothetical protein
MNNLARLDTAIKEQAAYYGVTVEQHKKFQEEMAELQEFMEYEDFDQ